MTCPSTPLLRYDGRWRHTCPRCGAVRVTHTKRFVARCSANTPAIDPTTLARRQDICRACDERPPGCWRARDHGCEREYDAAGRHAAETADCPLHKLT